MASEVIGSLRVDLGLNTAKFQDGARKAKGVLGGLSTAFKAFAVGAAVALSFGAIARSITSVIDKADELGKASQKIGIPVEALSKLEYAAKLADVSLEQLSTGVGLLSKKMGEIVSGEGGRAAGAMKAIGVSATDASGKLRPTIEVMSDIAEKFSRMKDGAGKTAIAMEIFGRSGAQIIPLLNAGRDGLREAGDELERFGGVISGQAAQAAENFNDNLTRLSTASSGFTTQITIGILPALSDLTDALVGFAKEGTLAENTIASLNAILEYTRGFLLAIGGLWNEISRWVAATGEAMQALGTGDFAGATAAFSKASAEINAMWADTKAKIDGTAQAVNRVGKGSLPVIQEDAPIIPSDSTEKVNKLTEAYQRLADAGQRVWEGTRTPLENYQLEIRKLNDLLSAGMIDHETYARAVKQLQDGFAQTGEAAETLGSQLAQTLGSTLQGWLDSAIEGTFKFKDALVDLLSQLAKVATNNLFTSIFSSAANPVQGGGILGAIGSLFGFAQGGSFQVGGSGGIDSQLVAFKASPNERVTVEKPGQERGGGPQSVSININLAGANGNAEVARIAKQSVKEGLREYQRQQPQAELERGLRQT